MSELAGDLKRAAGGAERIAQLLETKASSPTSRSPQHISLGAAAACEFHGANLCNLSLTDLREHIGLLPQEAVLFSSNLRDNIAFGKMDAYEATIIAASKQAQAYDVITSIDEGYDALIGEKGLRLSGGQRQRIAIARAILRSLRLLLWTRRQAH